MKIVRTQYAAQRISCIQLFSFVTDSDQGHPMVFKSNLL